MRTHKILDRNNVGRDFFVGDIHGYYDDLIQAQRDVGFDKQKDRLISVGDLIDRGPRNLDVLNLIEEPWFYAVRGNHEDMFLGRFLYLDISDDVAHQENGGNWADELWDEPEKDFYVDLVASLPLSMTVCTECSRIGVVHASAYASDWGVQERLKDYRQSCMWDAEKYHELKAGLTTYPVRGIQAVVSGHMAIETMLQVENQIFIDTLYRGGKFTLISSEEVIQRTARYAKQGGGQ